MIKTLTLDAYASAGVGVLALLLGLFFTRKLDFLKRLCIPAPVSGGLLVSLITLLLYALGVECQFDGTVKDLCMMLFFTSVGFQSDVRVLKKGGRFWRFHINFCPGWKAYFTHQDEETKAALRQKYNFQKYQ